MGNPSEPKTPTVLEYFNDPARKLNEKEIEEVAANACGVPAEEAAYHVKGDKRHEKGIFMREALEHNATAEELACAVQKVRDANRDMVDRLKVCDLMRDMCYDNIPPGGLVDNFCNGVASVVNPKLNFQQSMELHVALAQCQVEMRKIGAPNVTRNGATNKDGQEK